MVVNKTQLVLCKADVSYYRARIQSLHDSLKNPNSLLGSVSVDFAFSLQSPLRGLQIRYRQLGFDHIDVSNRIYTTIDMSHLRVLEAPDNMRYGVHLSYMRQKPVSKAFSSTRSSDQPSDINDLYSRSDALLRLEGIPQPKERVVRDLDNADILVYSAKRIVGCFCASI